MAATLRSTCVCLKEQETLTRSLFDDPNPHIRIIAHMSQRQLDMAEQVNDLTGVVSRLVEKVGELGGKLEGLSKLQGLLTTLTEKLDGVVLVSTSTESSTPEVTKLL